MNVLTQLSIKASTLRGIENILGWDQETYMPPGAAASRADQLKLVAGLTHEVKTSPEYKRALEQCVDLKTGKFLSNKFTPEEQACLREWRRDYLIESKLPASFVEEFTQVTAEGVEVWKKARNENDFALFAPTLDRIVQLSRKKADFLGYKDHPYDALLDLYEPDFTTKLVQTTFDEVQKVIVPLLQKVKQKRTPFKKRMSKDKQMELSQEILKMVGYDFNFGRIDISTHPFSAAPHPTDSRITTRLNGDDALDNLLTTLHEAGHALYEMGLPISKWGTPLAEADSTAIHESMSRFWETRIGLSKPFWEMMAPKLALSADVLYKVVNEVVPGFIRVDADEVSYPLHIILRFRLEKRLIEGSLKTKDLRAAWDKESLDLLGLKPKNDTVGCLQDIHWSLGSFGYFPSYLLGTLYASQLFDKFKKDTRDWEAKVKAGDLTFIKDWLSQKIYRHGRMYPPDQLIKLASGTPFSPSFFLNYLKEKYGSAKTF